jgi:hypothetical protein
MCWARRMFGRKGCDGLILVQLAALFHLTLDGVMSHRQAFPDCIRDVRLRFRLSLPLADATRDRRAFGNVCAVFVLVDADKEPHRASHSSNNPVEARMPESLDRPNKKGQAPKHLPEVTRPKAKL